ncbi:VC0807 family protein [Amycolatopsis orientalis]|uniref:VC0807 family protein n=1 Tax=Amycolatopsis orientalis TaxID=31958 RepID=UPI0003A9857B|nr:VC0807 family protein [Amycolatopsis orientalis]
MTKQARALITTMFLDVGLSVVAYYTANLLGASAYVSLLIGTVVAAARTIWVAVAQRRLDLFSSFLVLLFGLGLGLSFVTGDPRLLLAKESVTTFCAGVALVGSCVLNRPLAYYAARRFARSAGGAQQREFEATAHDATLRRRWYQISLVWGSGLIADSVLRIVGVYTLPFDTAAACSQALMVVAFAGLIAWTLLTRRRAEQPAQHRS